MSKERVLVSLDPDLLAQIDEQVGPRGRSAWIADACEAKLAAGGLTRKDKRRVLAAVREAVEGL